MKFLWLFIKALHIRFEATGYIRKTQIYIKRHTAVFFRFSSYEIQIGVLLFFYKSLNLVVHWFVPPLFLHLYYSTDFSLFQFIFYMNFILNFYSKGRTSFPVFQTLFTKNAICDIINLLARANRLSESSTNFRAVFLFII